MDFLKKNKSDPLDESLDLPPIPPPNLRFEESTIEDASEEEFPHTKEELEPFLPTMQKIPVPKRDIPQYTTKNDLSDIELPPFEPLIPPLLPPASIKIAKVSENIASPSTKQHTDQPFISVTNFKNITVNITSMRTTLRDLENSIGSLNEENSLLYDKWNTNLRDIQKKLVFVDQTIFKG
ncbi:MAG: hypothetical protein ABIC04_01660 [Nanoarchaeota archaeon]